MQKKFVDEFIEGLERSMAQQMFKLSYIKEKRNEALKKKSSKEVMNEFQVQLDALEKDIEELTAYKAHIEEHYG